MVKKCPLEGDLAPDIDNISIAAPVSKEAFGVDEATLAVDFLASGVLEDEWLTTRVHLNVAKDAVDVKASEWEDLWELAIVLQLGLQEKDFALSRANMAIFRDNVASLVDHESRFVDIYFASFLVLAHQELDETFAVAIKHAHDLLQFKRLAIVVEEFWHEASELAELSVVKPLNAMLVDDAAILVQ